MTEISTQPGKHKTLCGSNCLLSELPPATAERLGGNRYEIIVQLAEMSNVIAEAQAFAQTCKEIRP